MTMDVRLIKCEEEYRQVLSRIDALLNSPPGSPEADELELLGILVEAYEEEHFPMAMPSAAAAIAFRMEQGGLSEEDLAPIFGGVSGVRDVLEGKVDLTLEQVRMLHFEYGIPAEPLLEQAGRARPAA